MVKRIDLLLAVVVFFLTFYGWKLYIVFFNAVLVNYQRCTCPEFVVQSDQYNLFPNVHEFYSVDEQIGEELFINGDLGDVFIAGEVVGQQKISSDDNYSFPVVRIDSLLTETDLAITKLMFVFLIVIFVSLFLYKIYKQKSVLK